MGDNALIVTVKRPKGEDGYRTFSVRLREPVVSQMDDISRETGAQPERADWTVFRVRP